MSSQPRQKTFEVYHTSLVTIDKREVFFKYRGPSRAELLSAQSISRGNAYDFYEELIKECVVSPKVLFDEDIPNETEPFIDSDEFIAGKLLYLGLSIAKASGMIDKKINSYLSNQADEYLETEPGRLDCLALAVLPGLKPQDLFNSSPEDLFKIWKIAETLAVANGIDSRIFLNPEAYAKDVKKQQQQQLLEQKQQEANAYADQATNYKNRRRKANEGIRSFSI